MIQYIGKKKPEVDEFRLHLRIIESIMKKYKRIVVFTVIGGGKSYFLWKLQEKYANTDWNFYEGTMNKLEEPYIYGMFDLREEPDPTPEIYYILQYSTDYKEAISGVRFTDGFPRQLGEYIKYSNMYGFNSKDLRGKRVKSKEEMKKLVGGIYA